MSTDNKQLEAAGDINWPVVLVVIIGVFMAVLDSSIVNVALPKMMAVFGVSADTITWVPNAYMLAMGVIMPLSGYLGDTFGYKRCLLITLALFVSGSALCGLAWNIDSMIAARVIQALGGGLIQPLAMAILYQVCPREKMGMVLGVFGVSAMAAPAIGPILGGYLVQYADWRLIYYINVPIGIVNLFLAQRLLTETGLMKGEHLDLNGIILSSIGFFTLLLALNQSTSMGWSDPEIVILLAVAITSLIGFVINELRVPEPILDLRLFLNPIFAISNIIIGIVVVGLFAILFLEPQLIQNVLGQTAMTSGLITFPAAIAQGVMMPISGRIFDKYGARVISIVGLAIVIWASYAMHNISVLTAFSTITMLMMVRGVGIGLSLMPVMTAGMNVVPKALVGRASALTNAFRQIFASFGIAVLTSVMQSREAVHYAQMTASINTTSSTFFNLQQTLSGAALQLGIASKVGTLSLDVLYAKVATISAVQAIDDCFVITAALCAIAMVLCLFLKDRGSHSIKEPSSQQFDML
jgi:DHA2 family multidrug resistance protein